MVIISNEGTGQKIKQKRMELNLTVKQLVEKYFPNMSVQAYYQWENGKNTPSSENMLELCHVFGTSMEELYSYEYIDKTDGSK
jgi:DNA-binding XRE family transcriptional regulator